MFQQVSKVGFLDPNRARFQVADGEKPPKYRRYRAIWLNGCEPKPENKQQRCNVKENEMYHRGVTISSSILISWTIRWSILAPWILGRQRVIPKIILQRVDGSRGGISSSLTVAAKVRTATRLLRTSLTSIKVEKLVSNSIRKNSFLSLR